MKMKRITVKASEEFHRQIKVKAVLEGKSISDVVRALLQKWLDEEPKEQPPPP